MEIGDGLQCMVNGQERYRVGSDRGGIYLVSHSFYMDDIRTTGDSPWRRGLSVLGCLRTRHTAGGLLRHAASSPKFSADGQSVRTNPQ